MSVKVDRKSDLNPMHTECLELVVLVEKWGEEGRWYKCVSEIRYVGVALQKQNNKKK